MKTLAHYPKVLTLGSMGTSEVFDGEVAIQEKVDGSQFRFGKNEDGEVFFGSHRMTWENGICPDGMFKDVVSYLRSRSDALDRLPNDTYLFAEYLRSPKHNTMSYDRTPKNMLVLFDALCAGRWADRATLSKYADEFGIDLIPEFARTSEASVDMLRPMHEYDSYLGKEKIEGVVVKNYNKTIVLGGQVMPLFVKFVQSGFQERNAKNFRATNPRDNMADYVMGFASEARWLKAVQHLRDDGILTVSPKDIGPLIMEVRKDVKEEEAANIKDALFKFMIEEILRKATIGLPEWYKKKLVDDMPGGNPNVLD